MILLTFKFGDATLAVELQSALASLEKIERDVELTSTTPSSDLLEAVRDWLGGFGIEVMPSAAWQVWWAVNELAERLRKKFEPIAEIGHWCHVDASRLDGKAIIGLWQNIPRIKAQARLESGQYDPLDYRGIYALVLIATGDEQRARKAQADALERYVDSKVAAGAKA